MTTTHTPPGPRRRRGWIWPAITVLAATLGLLLGAAAITDAGAPQPEPAVPQACLDAITVAENGFDSTADAMTGLQTAWLAAELGDLTAVETAVDDIEAASKQLDALFPRWAAARADCRQAAAAAS